MHVSLHKKIVFYSFSQFVNVPFVHFFSCCAALSQAVVDAGVVPLLVLCIQEPEIALKRVAASALSDIAKHSPELAQTVVDTGAIAHLAQMILNPDAKLKVTQLTDTVINDMQTQFNGAFFLLFTEAGFFSSQPNRQALRGRRRDGGGGRDIPRRPGLPKRPG